MTPDWSILLKRIVNGNGSFTITHPTQSALFLPPQPQPPRHTSKLTNNKTAKKRINPPHNQRLRHHHRHVALEHIHHLVHSRRIRHRVRRRLSLVLRVLEELAAVVGRHEVVLARREGGQRELVEVGAE